LRLVIARNDLSAEAFGEDGSNQPGCRRVGKGAKRRAHESHTMRMIVGTLRFAHPTKPGCLASCFPIVIASAATCPPKPLAKAEAIQNPSAEGLWIASLRSQ